MKLSDYVMDFLVSRGVDAIFMVSGGGIMHLAESAGTHPRLRHYCNHHEQACAIAAEGYARVCNGIGACLVTTGPGSTNALSGVVGAWVDSIPVVTISGQVRRDLIADYSRLRQLGPQEINIIDMVRPVTKYATTVMDPKKIRFELERACALATSGRPGPVWVNIPLDVQAAEIDPGTLQTFAPEPNSNVVDGSRIRDVIELLQSARRPILVCGSGVRLAHAEEMLPAFVRKVHAPALLTIGAMDLMAETDEFYMGKFGPLGQRRANFALQNADLVLALGASLSVASIGYNTQGFAPKARIVMVNIDPAELSRPTLTPYLAVQADIREWIEEFLVQARDIEFAPQHRWLEKCDFWRATYPPLVSDYYEDREHVNSYAFAAALSEALAVGDAVLTGNSLDAWSVYQTFGVKRGQRVFTNVNYGAMGWDLPAAVGACVARGNRRTVLVTGDGSIQFNVHELGTIGHNGLDLKLFVLNNGGYESIRSTQKNYFGGHFVGADAASGVANPDFAKLAAAYGLSYAFIEDNAHVRTGIESVLAAEGPVLCELNVSFHQERRPKTSSYRREDGTMESRPLEDMFPFLPREEVWRNMHMFDDESA